MAAHLCCTADRCWTPVEPFTKIRLRSGICRPPEVRGPADSRHTSTRTEDLKEIQQLFDPRNLSDVAMSTTGHRSTESSTASSKYSKLTAFLLSRLPRKISRRHTTNLTLDLELMKQAKNELRSNLLTGHGLDAGGYDSDAAVIGNVDVPATPRKQSIPSRGRSSHQHLLDNRPELPAPLGPGRLSISFTPPRISIGSRRVIRRSQSMSSLPGRPGSPGSRLRLPSMSRDRESSYTWKRGVMDSLHISSPSASVLPTTSLRPYGGIMLDPPLYHSRMASTLTAKSENLERRIHPHSNSGFQEDLELARSPRSSDDGGSPAWPKPSFDQGLVARFGNTSVASGIARPHFFGRPERKIGRAASTTAATHLYNMGISRHLRSASSLGGVPATSPTRNQTPKKLCRMARSGFATEKAPEPWEQRKDGASPKYSTAIGTPPGSQVDVLWESCNETSNNTCSQVSSVETVTPSSSSRPPSLSSQQASSSPLSLPENTSTDNLSSDSQTSSKISRFKENLETPNTKKSRKRRSFINMVNKTLRHNSCSTESFDGTFDEPHRLQRALAITNRNDATGLMAKAIREKQAEKSMLYLQGNKEAAKHEVFRQRSASFCRPPGGSVFGGHLIDVDPGSSTQQTRSGSMSEGFLKPETFDPDLTFKLEEPLRRQIDDSGHLAPEFRTSIFSGSPILCAKSRSDSPSRTLSVSIDPTASDLLSAVNSTPRPSFQLNDVPAILETAPASIRPHKPLPATAALNRENKEDFQKSDLDLGAWSHYPSTSREARNGSAGARDDVKTRDFAYNVEDANILMEASGGEGRAIIAKKLNKTKKKWTSGIPQSKSMTLGKEILKGYSKLFRTSSIEWLAHGKGHRSSLSAGGTLEHPELELLPPIFAPVPLTPDDTPEVAMPGHSCIGTMQKEPHGARHADITVNESHAGLFRMDGSSDVQGFARRVDGLVRQVQIAESSSAAGGCHNPSCQNSAPSIFTLARQYEYSVRPSPRTSHSAASSHSHLTCESSSQGLLTAVPAGSDVPNLIDRMLDSASSSSAVTHKPTPLVSPFMSPLPSDTRSVEVKTDDGRGHTKGMSSVTSIRASSMDLLKTLQEAEERERQRAFASILSKAQVSASDERQTSSEHVDPRSGSLNRRAESIHTPTGSTHAVEYQIDGMQGGGG